MPYDAGLAARLAEVIEERFAHVNGFSENRMMGGFGYLLNGHMCVGIYKDTLIVRVGEEAANRIIKEPHVRAMDLTGKVMKGWATIEPEAMAEDDDLARYCRLAVEFVETLEPK